MKGFPTLVIYGADKKSPKPLNAREASAIVQAVVSEVQAVTSQRLAGKKPSSGGAGSKSGGGGGSGSGSKGGSGSKDGSGSGSKGGSGSPGEFGGPHITTLTSMNFPDQVLGSTEPWIVAFYAPWWWVVAVIDRERWRAVGGVENNNLFGWKTTLLDSSGVLWAVRKATLLDAIL